MDAVSFVDPSLISMAWSASAGARLKEAFTPPPAPAGPPAAPPGPGGMGADPSQQGNPGGGFDVNTLRTIVGEVVQQHMAGGGAAAGPAGAGGPAIKPKIDVNVELMQLKNMVAKILDAMQLPIPAQDMVATPEKLQAMATGQPTDAAGQTGQTGQAGQPFPPIQPVQPMGQGQPAKAAQERGEAFELDANTLYGRAAAAAAFIRTFGGR